MAPGAKLSRRSVAERRGIRLASLRALLVRCEPCLVAGGQPLSAAMLRPILRTAPVPHGR